ncbi:unnamed protein product [Agarophyton chilense]
MPALTFLFQLLTLLSQSQAAAIVQFKQGTDQLEPFCDTQNSFVFGVFIRGWWILFITLFTALPWAVVAVWDAIDDSYRRKAAVAKRLLLSTTCLLVAYVFGFLYFVALTVFLIRCGGEERQDEVATVVALLLFNVWHVGRNIFGWSQFYAIHRLREPFRKLQQQFALSFPGPPERSPKQYCIQGLEQLRVSNRLFDNEWSNKPAYLNPCFKRSQGISYARRTPEYEAWAVALWKAWWTQDSSARDGHSLTVSEERLKCGKEHRRPNVADLLNSYPSGLKPYTDGEGRIHSRVVMDQSKDTEITTKEEWAEALLTYGSDEGQQDTHGPLVRCEMNAYTARGIAILVFEKTARIPNRMSALWYNTSRFEEVYRSLSEETNEMAEHENLTLPSWASWLHIAQEMASNLERPVYLSDVILTVYAGELASASLILARYHSKYTQLVEAIHRIGLEARWTFGWSGLLACFSQVWTKERIFVAMLNGLSLLAMTSVEDVEHMDENVTSMLYGYAAFEVSDRAVGKRIAKDRKAELLKRYQENKGKTCRGSGVCTIRLACQKLDLPAEASHMDGLPAFSAGWASEFLEHKPGNQRPEHGLDHDQVEARHGSSNAWRYPHTQS